MYTFFIYIDTPTYVYVTEDQIYALADLIANQQQQAAYKVLVFFPTARHTGFVADLFNRVCIYMDTYCIRIGFFPFRVSMKTHILYRK